MQSLVSFPERIIDLLTQPTALLKNLCAVGRLAAIKQTIEEKCYLFHFILVLELCFDWFQ